MRGDTYCSLSELRKIVSEALSELKHESSYSDFTRMMTETFLRN